MSQFDPHQGLSTELVESGPVNTGTLRAEPQARPPLAVWHWMQRASEQFSLNPATWLAIAAVYTLMSLVIALVPAVQFSLSALWPVCLGGLMLGCAAVEQDEDLELGHLFAGFHSHLGQLLLLGLAFFVTIIVVCAMLAGTFGIAYLLVRIVHYLLGDTKTVELVLATVAVLVGSIVVVVTYSLMLTCAVIVWFATPLVVLHEMKAWDALKLSFRGVLLNRWTLAILCVIVSALTVLSFMAMLLGFLLWLPLWWITIYSAYKDIFVERGPAVS